MFVLRLAALLLTAVAAFPVTGVAVITLEVLGGTHYLYGSDVRVIAIIAGVASGAVVLVTAMRWQRAPSRSPTRSMGWLMIAVVTAIIVAGTVYFFDAHAPENVQPPTVRGAAQVGWLLSSDPGRWNSPTRALDFSYRWQRCQPSCTDILGATERVYSPVERDVGSRLRVGLLATAARAGARDFASDWAYSRKTMRVTDP